MLRNSGVGCWQLRILCVNALQVNREVGIGRGCEGESTLNIFNDKNDVTKAKKVKVPTI